MGRISARTKILAIVLALFVVAAAIIFTVVFKVANETQPAVPSSYEKLEYNGVTYKPASYRINVLFMGIDEAGKAVSSGSYLNSGLADFLCLLSFDVRTKECVAIHINRDTITDVRMYGIGGKYLGKAPMQIALAHQYGDGLNDSCLNTAKAVHLASIPFVVNSGEVELSLPATNSPRSPPVNAMTASVLENSLQ